MVFDEKYKQNSFFIADPNNNLTGPRQPVRLSLSGFPKMIIC